MIRGGRISKAGGGTKSKMHRKKGLSAKTDKIKLKESANWEKYQIQWRKRGKDRGNLELFEPRDEEISRERKKISRIEGAFRSYN